MSATVQRSPKTPWAMAPLPQPLWNVFPSASSSPTGGSKPKPVFNRQTVACHPPAGPVAGQPEEFIQQGPCKPQPLVPVPSTVEPSWTGVHLAPLRALPGRRRAGSQHRPAAIPALCWEGLGFQCFGFDTVITGRGGNTRGEKPGCLEPALCAGPHRSAVPAPALSAGPFLPSSLSQSGMETGSRVSWPVWGRARASEPLS